MNKQTIVKYEKEFIAWCKGDPVLIGFPASMEDAGKGKLSWRQVISFDDWKALDTKYVLDNEYSTFAKALAEGKTIQGLYINPTIQLTEWIDTNTIDMLNYKPEQLRIKPEEPQFKVGNFVRIIPKSEKALTNYVNQNSIGIVKYVTDTLINVKTKNTTYWFKLEDCIKYTPQEGELCWFTNKNFNSKLQEFDDVFAILSIFREIIDNKFEDDRGVLFTYCEPFLNSTPSWFKN